MEHDQELSSRVVTHDGVIQRLVIVGFDIVCRLSSMPLDWYLLSVMVERWCPETHTFHLRHGEMTLRLGDVAVISRLLVDGRVVSGTQDLDWQSLCLELLGSMPKDIG